MLNNLFIIHNLFLEFYYTIIIVIKNFRYDLEI